jgi:pyruvate ferredoxin oxidoreductase delta subunit
MCLAICPEGCIQEKEKNAFICDYNYCKGCGLCALVCPKKDIVMIGEETEGEKK